MWWLRLREIPARLRRDREAVRRNLRGRVSSPDPAKSKHSRLWLVGLGFVVLALHLVLFPPVPRFARDFSAAGDIADREIRAPFPFSAPLPEQEVRMQRLARVVEVPPILKRLPAAAVESQNRRLRDFFAALQSARSDSLNAEAEAGLLALQFPMTSAAGLRRLLESGDPDSALVRLRRASDSVVTGLLADMLPAGKYDRVTLVNGNEETTVKLGQVVTQSRLEERLLAALREAGMAPVEAADAAALLRPFLAPNLVYDPNATQARQDVVRQQVPTTCDFITGERIVDQGVRVTEEQAQFLEELARQIQARGGGGNSWDQIVRYLVRGLAIAIGLGLFGWLGVLHFPALIGNLRWSGALTVILGLFLAGSSFALGHPSLGPLAVPIVLLALLATVLFRQQVGYASTLLALLLLVLLPELPAQVAFFWLVLGMVTVISVRRIQKRSQFYRTIVLLTGLSILQGALLPEGALAGGPGQGGWLLVAIFTPVLSVAFGMFLLPVVEPLVGICSDLTLLELSDLNHPLLQRMALEAQGTYHHSQVVGQLAEQAARSINANALLTRVGALFHDIGKMEKSEYYVENQSPNLNKHDELSPSMSALVIAAHVKEGIELARKWRLPQTVIDFIPEHHGTMVMEFFYRKALEGEGNKTVKVDDFRYPGPKPHSRETAVLMLADATEAATRSLARPTPSRIREMVKQIIDKRMLAGELDQSGLTLRDLAMIREAFIPLLTGIHHSRIAYPGQRRDPVESKEKEDAPEGSGRDKESRA